MFILTALLHIQNSIKACIVWTMFNIHLIEMAASLSKSILLAGLINILHSFTKRWTIVWRIRYLNFPQTSTVFQTCPMVRMVFIKLIRSTTSVERSNDILHFLCQVSYIFIAWYWYCAKWDTSQIKVETPSQWNDWTCKSIYQVSAV